MADVSLGAKVKIMLGYCPANMNKDDLVVAIKEAQSKIGIVIQGGEILQGFQERGTSLEKLKEANANLGKLLEMLDKVDSICKDLIALEKIHNALANISTDDFRQNPVKAGQAFDDFFVGIGRFCRLTPILKPYQQFFESFKLFEPMARMRQRREAEWDRASQSN